MSLDGDCAGGMVMNMAIGGVFVLIVSIILVILVIVAIVALVYYLGRRDE